MIRGTLITLMAVALLSSCGSQGSKDDLVLGYKTITHKATGGPVANVGDFVFFNLDIYDDQRELVDSSPRDDNRPVLQILDTKDVPTKANPAMALMAKIAVGDSVSLFIPKDSMPPQQAVTMTSEFIEYVIVAHSIVNEEDFNKLREERQAKEMQLAQEAMAKAPKIIEGIEVTLKDYLAGKTVGTVKEGPDGLKIIVIEEGEGPTANDGDNVSVAYAGYLYDMSTFDDSFKRGKPYTFKLGQGSVITGWDKGLVYLNKGSKAILDIPFEMAYGAAGRPPSIPAKSPLLFYVELEDIK